MLGRTGLRAVDKSLPPGALITFLQKGLQYVGVEESLHEENAQGSGKASAESESEFSLLSPQSISAISRPFPPIQLNVPPAAAAAAVKARLESEAKKEAERNAAAVSTQLSVNGPLATLVGQAGGIMNDPRQAFNAISQLQQMTQPAVTMADAFYQQQQRQLSTATDMIAFQAGPQATNQLAGGEMMGTGVTPAALVGAQGTKRTASGAPKRSGKKPKITIAKPDISEGRNRNPSGALVDSTGVDSSEKGSSSSAINGPQATENDQNPTQIAKPAHADQESMPLPPQELVNGQSDRNGTARGNHPRSNGEHDDELRNADYPDDDATFAREEDILKLEMHQSEVFMCAWNPIYTNLIATGSGDASARIWEMADKFASAGLKSVNLLPHGSDPRDRKNKDVTTLEWSPDGSLLATGSYDGVARVWARNGQLIHTLHGHGGPIFSLKWNKRGNYLLSGSYDKTTMVWDVSESTGYVRQTFRDHEAPALDVDWRDNETFASCSTDKTVHICRVGANAPIKIYAGHADEVNAVKWDPSGRYLASCSDDCTAKIWDIESDRSDPLYDLKSHEQEIYTVKWSPTGPGSPNPSKKALLATASFDGSVRLWSILDGSCFRVFNRHRDSVYSVAFSPSGEYLASGSLAGQMYIWNIEEDRHVKSYKGKGDIFEVAWNKEETRVAACFSSNVVAVVDFDKSKLT